MPGVIRRALFAAALCAPVTGCGDGGPRGYYGACDYVFIVGAGDSSSCWEAHARTVPRLQELRATLCGGDPGDLRPIGSRCSRDGALGGCLAVFGDAAGIKWYYGSTSVGTAADVMEVCLTGDGERLAPGQQFVPPDGDFPPLD